MTSEEPNQLPEAYLHKVSHLEWVKRTEIMETGWGMMIVQWVICMGMLMQSSSINMVIKKLNLMSKETQLKNWLKTKVTLNQYHAKELLDT